MSDHLPASRRPPAVVHPTARALQSDVMKAAEAVRAMPRRRRSAESDVTVAAYAAVVCTGSTPTAALQEAAKWTQRAAAGYEIHATNWATVPGHREDVSEYRITLTVSFPDVETGETTGDTHHGTRR